MSEESATTLVTLDGSAAIQGMVARVTTFLDIDEARVAAEGLAVDRE